ncbi:MAG: glycosyltransferase [Deltaproteobacteria bacterium]|nr:glycosyltransferase [Deltaproteobacteria bacterium]
MQVTEGIFWFSVLGVFYPYLGYPLILFLLNKKAKTRVVEASGKAPLSASIIITCRNEEQVIGTKLDNTLSLKFRQGSVQSEGVEVIVASDASEDGTDQIVKEYAQRGVRLIALGERGGKECAQARALESARGEIIIFTDARTRLKDDALEKALKYFDDKQIGAVSSMDVLEGDKLSGEGAYVGYEMTLRRIESEFYSLVGLSGSAFAVRKSICQNLDTTIPSDFACLMKTVKCGYRGKLAEDFVCYYGALNSAKAEYKRKVRTVLRGITALFVCREMMNIKRFGVFSWELISHKLCRWLVPWFIAIAALSLFSLREVAPLYSSFFWIMCASLLLAALGFADKTCARSPICKIPMFFLLSNAAILHAWIKWLSGKRQVSWTPSDR